MATLGIFHPSVYTFNQSLIARVIIFSYSHIYQQTTHSFWVSMNIEHQIKLYFTSFKQSSNSCTGEKHWTLGADRATVWGTQKGRLFTSLTQPRFEAHRWADFSQVWHSQGVRHTEGQIFHKSDTAKAWGTQRGRFFTSLTQPRFGTHTFFYSNSSNGQEGSTNIILKENHPQNIPPNFASKWFCSFRAVDCNVKSTSPLPTYTKL